MAYSKCVMSLAFWRRAAGLFLAFPSSLAFGDSHTQPPRVPEFTHQAPADWINSPPLKLANLRGQVVLIDFWTFECWNCYRSFPWLRSVEERYHRQDLQVVGVHTPEFEHERVRSSIVNKAKEFGLHHPIMLDNDFSYWRALGNRYWPAFLPHRSMGPHPQGLCRRDP